MRAFQLCLAAAVSLFLAGCATTSPFASAERPEVLDPFRLDRTPDATYQAAMALAFDRGYNIAYSVREEGLIEMDRADERFLLETRVRRLDVLIQPLDTLGRAQSLVRVRYQSFPVDDPARTAVQDADREAAIAFAEGLRQRIAGQ